MNEYKVTLQRNVIHSATLTIMANDSTDAEARAYEMLADFSANIAWDCGVVNSDEVIAVKRTMFRYYLVGVFNESGESDQSLIQQNKYFTLRTTPTLRDNGFNARDYDDAIRSLNGKDGVILAVMSARSTADLCGKLDDLNIYIIDETGHIIAKEDTNVGDGNFVKV